MQQDIIERLEKRASQIGRDRSMEHANIIVADVLLAELTDAIAEIKRLRALAGAVTAGESFQEIREKAR